MEKCDTKKFSQKAEKNVHEMRDFPKKNEGRGGRAGEDGGRVSKDRKIWGDKKKKP